MYEKNRQEELRQKPSLCNNSMVGIILNLSLVYIGMLLTNK